MRFNLLFFLLSLSCLYLALAQVSYEDCCLTYVKQHKTVKKLAVMYRVQETDGGCNIPAIVFTMRRGRRVCGDPREEWVKALMKNIDKSNSNSNSNPKHKHYRHPKRG
ncbi:C-C motif chemokine 21 [Anabas testudineus]|uniref:Chemokine interleukin-8-like domain-containing protein n=1 Tax=Anabas testudineus TaxID=64144 RepID=A0A3Q1KAK4_ANATE|nr:C-C motif chemokine 21 [Anabas testudineus]